MHSESIVAWLLTFALHASVLLALALIIDRGALRAPAWRELLWRTALFGGVLTASVQTSLDLHTSPRFALAVAQLRAPASVVALTEATAQPELATRPHSADVAPAAVVVARAAPATQSNFAPERSANPSGFGGIAWQTLLLAAWLAGSLLALFRLTVTWWRLERALRQAEPLHDATIATDAAALALQAGVRVPRLAVLDELASPFAARGRRIVLPRWACELLDREQLRAMLAHETAHLARHDAAWKFAIALCRSLLWFLPLAGIARRRLDETAELACDA